MSTINYIQFVSEVPLGGDFASLPYYSREKHKMRVEVEEKGSWVIIHLLKDDGKGKLVRTGERRRVPITNVVAIIEADDEPKGK